MSVMADGPRPFCVEFICEAPWVGVYFFAYIVKAPAFALFHIFFPEIYLKCLKFGPFSLALVYASCPVAVFPGFRNGLVPPVCMSSS